MSFWTFVFLCVVAGIVYDLARKDKLHQFTDMGMRGGLGAKRRKGVASTDSDDARSQREAELLRELTDLRERVKVLERIATDEHDTRRLSAEIERLREQ